MIIDRLKLTNWCQHRELDIEFSPKSNGIVGANSRGKSNLTKAIRVALTGRTDPGDNLANDITDGENGATIELHFTHDGQQGVLTRKFYRTSINRAYLKIGTEELKNIKPVNAYIETMLGASPETIEKYSFVGQDQLRAILFDTPTKRLENLISIIPEIAKTRLYRERVSDFIDSIPVVEMPYSEEHVDESIGSHNASIETINAQLVMLYAKKFVLDQKAEAFRASIQAHDTYATTKAAFNNMEESLQVDHQKMDLLKQQFDILPESGEEIEMSSEDYATACTRIRQYDTTDHPRIATATYLVCDVDTIAQMEVEVTKAQSELEGVDAEIEAFQAELTAKHEEMLVAEGQRKVWDNIDLDAERSSCPICDSHMDKQTILDQANEDTNRVARLREDWLELQGNLNIYKNGGYQTVHTHFVNTSTALTTHHQSMTAAQLFLDSIPEDLLTPEEYKETDRKLQSMSQYAKRKLDIDNAKTQIVILENHIQSKLVAKGQLESGLREVPEWEYNEASTGLQSLSESAISIGTLESQIVNTAVELQKYMGMRAELDELKSKKDVLDVFREKAEKVKAMLHRDQLPTMILRYYMSTLRSHLSTYLNVFNVPFNIHITDDFDMTFTKDGNEEKPLHRLSGGEKSVLSTAMHLAVSDMFCGGLQLLVLDEPSQNMDTEYVSTLTNIIESMSGGLASGDRQLCIVTHHANEMLGAFSNVIEL